MVSVLCVHLSRGHAGRGFVGQRGLFLTAGAVTANRVDEFTPRRGGDPGCRVVEVALLRPGAAGRRESLLQRLFGKIKGAGEPDQCSEDPARLFRNTSSRGGNLPDYDWTDLNAAVRRAGDFRGIFDSRIQIFAIENVEAAGLFFGLREESVSGEGFAVPHAHGGGGCGGVQGFPGSIKLLFLHLIGKGESGTHNGLLLFL
jgi:hypothetical protein